MELQHIRYFLGLSKELHFWHTAEKMFITQSALSRHIKMMEDELGFLLFKRDKRNVQLTEAGKFMQQEWEKMIVQIDNIHQKAKLMDKGEVGTFRIGHPGSIAHSFLPDIAAQLSRDLPQVDIEFLELMTIDLGRALLDFEVDAGFRREITDSALLETKFLFSEDFAVVVPSNHHITANTLENIKDFKNEKFILPDLSSRTRYTRMLSKIFEESDIQPNIKMASEFGTTITSLIARGLGISILPISYASNASDKIRFIRLPYRSELFLQWRKGDENPILKNFIALIENFEFSE